MTQEAHSTLALLSRKFFNNLIPLTLLPFLEKLHHEYRFSTELIEALFMDARDKGFLHRRGDIAALAGRWKEQGISDLETLENYRAQCSPAGRLERWLGRKLGRRHFTADERRIIKRWAEEEAFSQAFIEEVLALSIHHGAVPGLRYFDTVLHDWRALGIENLEDYKRYRERMKQGASGRSAKHQKRKERPEFEDHIYSPEFYD